MAARPSPIRQFGPIGQLPSAQPGRGQQGALLAASPALGASPASLAAWSKSKSRTQLWNARTLEHSLSGSPNSSFQVGSPGDEVLLARACRPAEICLAP
jgi:hypothetical protein